MIRTLTDKEVEEWKKDIDHFFDSLDYSIKNDIKRLIEPILLQCGCNHDWIDPNTYENNLDKNYLHCSKCHMTQKIIKFQTWGENEKNKNMEEKKFYEIHRSTAITILLKYEKQPTKHTNLRIAELLEEYYPKKNRSYIVKEDNLLLDEINSIKDIKSF
jgi:hypothetical protein